MENENGMNWVWIGSSNVQVHGYYKAKTKQKPSEDEKRRENGTIRTHHQAHAVGPGRTTMRPSTTGRAPHHGQAVVPTILAGLAAPRTIRFGFLWTLIWAAKFSCIGLILQHCLIYMPQLHLAWIQLSHFPKNLAWIIQICNQHSRSQNKRNWRNRGENHKIKPIYPKKWILNTYLILCKYGTDQLHFHMSWPLDHKS